MSLQANKLFALALFILFVVGVASSCQHNCKMGFCTKENKCKCFRNFVGADCSVEATKVSLANPHSAIPVNNSAYFYFPITQTPSMMTFTFTKPEDVGAKIYMAVLENQNSDLSAVFEKEVANFPVGEKTLSQMIYQGPLKTNIVVKKVIIIVYATERVDEVFVIGSYEDEKACWFCGVQLITVLIPLITGVVSSCAVITIAYIVIKRRLRAANPYLSVAQTEVLNKNEINLFFPRKEFSSLTSTIDHNTCSICIEDFQPDSICRQLYCQHIHHASCIDAWLEKRSMCPDCRNSMTIQAIQENFGKGNISSNQKLLDEAKPSQSPVETHAEGLDYLEA